ATLEQVIDNIKPYSSKKDVKIVQFNQLSTLDIDEIGSEEEDNDYKEIDEFTIKDLLERIVNALKPFELATKFFSGSKYLTLSLIYFIIYELQNKFMNFSLELSDNNENSDNKDVSFVDPWTKKISAFTNREYEKAETKLKNEYKNLQHLNITSNDQPKQQISIPIITKIMQNLFFEGIFEVQVQEDMPLDEVAQYLKIAPINYNSNSWQ
ncbi:1225_t:CDS:2, partial [Dentiscutata heterogama]